MLKSFEAILKRHAHMIFDMERSVPLIHAIEKTVKPGDVVVDVGCGIGLLSFAAIHAGAKRVYAIDVDGTSLEFARWQAKQLGMENQICFLEDHSFNVELIEKGDLLIQETVGHLAFDENFLITLEDAKKRFLKPNGKIIPEEISLYGAPVDENRKLLAKPSPLLKIKTDKPCKKCVEGIQMKKKWPVACAGVLVWPHVVWAKGHVTDCAPSKKLTHWKQTFFPYISDSKKVGAFHLNIAPHPGDPSYSEVFWRWG